MPYSCMWKIQYQFYRLSKVKMWRTEDKTTGFRVWYTPPKDYFGWPSIRYTFGKKSGHIEEEVKLSKDLLRMQLCFHTGTGDANNVI